MPALPGLPITNVGINKNSIHIHTEKLSDCDGDLFAADGLLSLRLAAGKAFYIFDDPINQPIGLRRYATRNKDLPTLGTNIRWEIADPHTIL